jgi:hypothetical protein
MDINEFMNKKDNSKVKDNSLKNFKTANKQRKLDKFVQFNYNPNTPISIKEQKKLKKLDTFKKGGEN